MYGINLRQTNGLNYGEKNELGEKNKHRKIK